MTKAEEPDRRLVLLRHAKSAWPDVPDRERPLAGRGRRDAPRVGRWLGSAGLVPDLVVCSVARRTRETWQLVQGELGAEPPVRFDDRVYQASAAQLLALIRSEPPTVETLLVVGHEPAISELASALAESALGDDRPGAGSGSAPGEMLMLDRLRAKFPTAAVAVLDCAGGWDELGPGSAQLSCFITPHDLPRPPVVSPSA